MRLLLKMLSIQEKGALHFKRASTSSEKHLQFTGDAQRNQMKLKFSFRTKQLCCFMIVLKIN